MSTTSIEAILKKNMNKVEELMNTNSKKYDFNLKDGKIQFTGYVGKKGILAKSACSYVRVYLEAVPMEGLEYSPIKTFTEQGGIYNKDAWIITDKNIKLEVVLELFQSIVDTGRKLYKDSKK